MKYYIFFSHSKIKTNSLPIPEEISSVMEKAILNVKPYKKPTDVVFNDINVNFVNDDNYNFGSIKYDVTVTRDKKLKSLSNSEKMNYFRNLNKISNYYRSETLIKNVICHCKFCGDDKNIKSINTFKTTFCKEDNLEYLKAYEQLHHQYITNQLDNKMYSIAVCFLKNRDPTIAIYEAKVSFNNSKFKSLLSNTFTSKKVLSKIYSYI